MLFLFTFSKVWPFVLWFLLRKGYLAREHAFLGQLSEKSNVYNYGILIAHNNRHMANIALVVAILRGLELDIMTTQI